MVLVLVAAAVISLLYFAIDQGLPPSARRYAPYLTICAFVATALCWIPALGVPNIAWDFPGFYIAANVPLHSLYDHTLARAFGESNLLDLGVTHYPPYVRPAGFALLFRPLRYLPYWPAFWVWAIVSFVSYCISVVLFHKFLKLPTDSVPALAAFVPAMFGIIQGQDITVVLLCLTAGVLLTLRGRPILGGLLIGLCCYKFNLVWLIPLALVLHRRWRTLLGFCVSSGTAALVSVMLVPAREYLAFLPTLPQINDGQIGGLRGILIGLHAEVAYPIMAGVLLLVVGFMMRMLPVDKAIGLAIVAGVLLSPQSAWYDLTIALLPFALCGGKCEKRLRFVLLAVIVAVPLWIVTEKQIAILFGAILVFAMFRASRTEKAGDINSTHARAASAALG